MGDRYTFHLHHHPHHPTAPNLGSWYIYGRSIPQAAEKDGREVQTMSDTRPVGSNMHKPSGLCNVRQCRSQERTEPVPECLTLGQSAAICTNQVVCVTCGNAGHRKGRNLCPLPDEPAPQTTPTPSPTTPSARAQTRTKPTRASAKKET